MEKDEKKSDVVEEKNSEATEEIATPTPYKHPSRSLLEKEDEKTATEESKEESDEKKPKEDHPVGVEDAVFKKRYDDLKRHYDETISKHKDEVLKLRKEKEAVASKPIFKSKEELEEWRKDYPDMYDSVMQLTTEASMKAKQEMEEDVRRLNKEINEVKPNVIIAMGSLALWALTGLDKIGTYRGIVLKSNLTRGTKVLPTFSPSAVVKNYDFRPIVLSDLKKGIKESDSQFLETKERELWIEPCICDLKKFDKPRANLRVFCFKARG